ncbi:MAG TPA: hypothetical protein PKN75_12065 [Bacteroidia bacterium]|nr:hypothetical protein [Bacteroidia bacterium]HNU34312.1 hypothetical protein [Bacteroidia bacterium]
MKYLSKFSPAESVLILQDRNSNIKELLKVTFMDLLLKQVVRTFDVQRQTSRREGVRIYKYVEAGKNFLSYEPLPHEIPVLAPFQKSNSVQILFRHIVKMSYQNSKSETAYRKILLDSPNLDRCFSKNIYQSLFGGFSVTADGQELRKKVRDEIETLEKTLPGYISSNHQKALDILKEIKGNIFLLTNIQFDLLQQLDRELISEMNRYDRDDGRGGCSGSWGGFGDYSHTFDSSCSGHSGGGGCSSCGSGCSSGCSGCGGGCSS